MPEMFPLASCESTGLYLSVAVCVTTFSLLVPFLVRTVRQWQHSIQKVKKPLPATIPSQVSLQSSNFFKLVIQPLISLAKMTTSTQMIQGMTITKAVEQSNKNFLNPIAPTTIPAIMMTDEHRVAVCIEASCLIGTLVCAILGSFILKNISPNPPASVISTCCIWFMLTGGWGGQTWLNWVKLGLPCMFGSWGGYI